MQKPMRTQSEVTTSENSAQRGEDSQATGPIPTCCSSVLMTP
jgi:hypothetical protein